MSSTKYLRKFINRNPRNLERMGIQSKNTGYQYEKRPGRNTYFYRVEFNDAGKHMEGNIRHYKDGIVATASTKEWPIAKQLYSTNDTCAAMNIGSILARRCLMYGINFAIPDNDKETIEKSTHLKAFYESLEKGGLMLDEPEMIKHTYEVDAKRHWDKFSTYPGQKSGPKEIQ